jgi:hypothetical protein
MKRFLAATALAVSVTCCVLGSCPPATGDDDDPVQPPRNHWCC